MAERPENAMQATRRSTQPGERHCFTCQAVVQLRWYGSDGRGSSFSGKGNVGLLGRRVRKSAGSRCCVKAKNAALIHRTKLTNARVGANTAQSVAAIKPSNAQV
mmetsp:Transcript_31610/g.66022  ORF Transcript_31610/g.66022 Transcript_31610/m.66022 type:complete len:104 (+) Transcript_31610:456-767(+)